MTDMKKFLLFPSLTVFGSAAAFVLRLLFCRTGFEDATGLPIPGNLYGTLFLILLVVLAVAFWVSVRRLPDEGDSAPATFAAAFSTSSPGLLTLPVAGIFLLAASGLYDIYQGLLVVLSRGEMVVGVLTFLSAVCLFSVVPSCRTQSGKAAASRNANLLLVPVCYLVVRLVLTYREDSINPSLSAYYVEILALVFLTLAFYRLSSFAFQVGRSRRFFLYAMPATVLCVATLADGHSLSASLLYASSALTMLGFMLLRLDVLSQGECPSDPPSSSAQ